MLNKKFWLKIAVSMCFLLGLGISFVSAASFNIDLSSYSIQAMDEESILKNIMPIHFVDNWNDFGWFLYVSEYGTPTSEAFYTNDLGTGFVRINLWENGSWYVCVSRVKWFYYNSERWERLFPIDEETANLWAQDWLNTNGWLYTRCYDDGIFSSLDECVQWEEDDDQWEEDNDQWEEDDDQWEEDNDQWEEDDDQWEEDYHQCQIDKMNRYGNLHGYYWSVTHEYNWKTFGLTVWTQYTWVNQTGWLYIDDTVGLSETFIRYKNQYPVWLLYDYNWWVWFVWCEFQMNKTSGLRSLVSKLIEWQKLEDLFYYDTDNHTIAYSGLDTDINLDCSNISAADSLIKMVVDWLLWLGIDSQDLNTIGNNVSNSKMQYLPSANINNASLINYAKKRAEILCRWKRKTYRNDSDLEENLNCINNINNWTNTINAKTWYTYIVKNWNVEVSVMNDFDSDGYYNIFIDSGYLLLDNENLWEYKKVFKKDWFISNTDIEDYKSNIENALSEWLSYTWNDVAVGVFIKWNFIVNWNLTWDNINTRYFVYWKFTTKDSLNDLVGDEWIFIWRCGNWISSDSDEYYCPQSRNDWINPYTNSALNVIDQNYDSILFNS